LQCLRYEPLCSIFLFGADFKVDDRDQADEGGGDDVVRRVSSSGLSGTAGAVYASIAGIVRRSSHTKMAAHDVGAGDGSDGGCVGPWTFDSRTSSSQLPPPSMGLEGGLCVVAGEPLIWSFCDTYLHLPNFEVASDAFQTLKESLQLHKVRRASQAALFSNCKI
jgi:hypothetical protein